MRIEEKIEKYLNNYISEEDGETKEPNPKEMKIASLMDQVESLTDAKNREKDPERKAKMAVKIANVKAQIAALRTAGKKYR